MSVATTDIYKALNAAWDASGLDAKFTALWSGVVPGEYEVLCDQEASPRQPFPYCVVDQITGMTVARMSADGNGKREVRDLTLRLNVHAQDVSGDSRSSKGIAAYLAEEVMKVFGGHSTVSPTATLALDNGQVLIVQYANDYMVRTDDDKTQATVEYVLRVDVPVAV